MRAFSPILPLAAALSLAACGDSPPATPDDTDPVVTVDTEGQPGQPLPAAPPPPDGSAEGENDGYPDISPAPLTPEAERSDTGARNLLLAFARGIELAEFDQAWALLSEGDRQRWSKAEFAAQFADLDEITVAVPEGTSEGAAGSIYYTTPITVSGNDTEGRPIRYEGEAVLRRVNDVDGASPEQLRWHFDQLTFDWTH